MGNGVLFFACRAIIRSIQNLGARHFMGIFSFSVKLEVLKGHFRKRNDIFSNCKILVHVLPVPPPRSYATIWSLLITANLPVKIGLVLLSEPILVWSCPHLVVWKIPNAVLKFRMSGLVTFKLFANTYVTNVCILYALFSIVGLDANFD